MFNCKNQVRFSREWSKSLESIFAKNLVRSIIKGDRILQKIFKSQSAANRAAALLESKEAGKIFELQAQTHKKRFISSIQKQKLLFDRFIKEMKPYEEQWKEFVKSGKIKERLEYARNLIILHTIYSDMPTKDAEVLLKQFDERLKNIQALASLGEIEIYINKYFKLIIEIEFNLEEFLWKLCVTRWSLTGEFEMLVIIWFFYCLSIQGQEDPEVTCLEWWDDALYEACGVPPGEFDYEWFEDLLERIAEM
ncbi:MAG: hypothetical protein ACFFAI_09980 [Promethearchaeota archaeon]